MLYLLKSKNPEYWDDAGRQRLVEASSEQEARQIASEEPLSVEPSNYWSDPEQTVCREMVVRRRKRY